VVERAGTRRRELVWAVRGNRQGKQLPGRRRRRSRCSGRAERQNMLGRWEMSIVDLFLLFWYGLQEGIFAILKKTDKNSRA
jgi:hypothetical protein